MLAMAHRWHTCSCILGSVMIYTTDDKIWKKWTGRKPPKDKENIDTALMKCSKGVLRVLKMMQVKKILQDHMELATKDDVAKLRAKWAHKIEIMTVQIELDMEYTGFVLSDG